MPLLKPFVEVVMKMVKLTQGYMALVDDEDFEKVMQHKWHVAKGRDTMYAVHSVPGGKWLLHRWLKGITDTNTKVDHEDHCGLNNQKSNLRIATESQNQANSMLPSTNSSGIKGVYKYKSHNWKSCKKWKAQIRFQGKNKALGYFDTKEEAQTVYDKVARELFGEFALTNAMMTQKEKSQACQT